MSAVSPIDSELAYDIGVEGYTYLYPLLLMEITRQQFTNVTQLGDAMMKTPKDTFMHVPAFPPAGFRGVVRPNFDTLYSAAFLDVHTEPKIVSVPAAGEEYYLLPFYDMWGEVFASPGTRTTGSAAGHYAICPPGWSGELPPGVRAYLAPTPWVWVIGRTAASVDTFARVRAFQAGMAITPLSSWGGQVEPVTGTVDPSVDDVTPPLRQVFSLDAATFFARAATLIAEHPPHAQDYPMLDRLARIGFQVGEPFALGDASPEVRAALIRAAPDAQQRITAEQKRMGVVVDGWQLQNDSMGNYGTNYLHRACVELVGLGANLAEDAVYPFAFVDRAGEPLTGANSYVWHFDKGGLPPVRGFWSLTVYDDEGFQVANELNRFAIGDRDPLTVNDDGSLDIFIQHVAPASGTSNWLPTPAGSFNLTARFYEPEQAILDSKWTPPGLRKV